MNTITKAYYNPSINIKRDLESSNRYIPTPNSQLVYEELSRNFQQGSRSFTMIGAYGTGKSSFLLALENHINNKKKLFNTSAYKWSKKFEVLPIIGEYRSIVSAFAEEFDILISDDLGTRDLLKSIDDYANQLKDKGLGLAIYVDEFGKFLEYASKNNPETELYFIQQLAELANDLNKDILFVCTLHQGFNSYSRRLSIIQQQEWDKVKGRLIELTFNEPVEQLLFLASERLEETLKIENGNSRELFEVIKKSKAFPLRAFLSFDLAKKLLPFDILSVSILTIALQRYGQNQRSLFSFIDSNAHLSVNDFDNSRNPFYNISNVFDYVIHNYFSFVTSKYNPDFTLWASIRVSLERVEGIFESGIENAQKIIKTIGLLQGFSSHSATIDKGFLIKYSKLSLGINDPEQILKKLEHHKIIIYSGYSRKYKLFEGTDLDIELEIERAENLIQKIGNLIDYLTRSFDFPYILAKEAYYETGTPRYFGFNLSDYPKELEPNNEIDGYINLIFNEDLSQNKVLEYSKQSQEATLFGLFNKTGDIKNTLFEIEKIKKVIELNKEDRFALKELTTILEHQRKILNHYILDSINSDLGYIEWYYRGQKVNIQTSQDLNKQLSRICRDVYSGTPVLKNELFNKSKLSSAITIARKNLINHLLNNHEIEDLGFSNDKFPPEKTIYLALLKETGIHFNNGSVFGLRKPTEDSFNALWKASTDFLESATQKRRQISQFASVLQNKPLKLKQGFIDFWIPVFLYLVKDQYFLFEDDIFIPSLTDESIDLIVKRPDLYELKTINLSDGYRGFFEKYREFLNLSNEGNPTNLSFIEAFKPFVVFYNNLNNYCANTSNISQESIRLRASIAGAVDPELSFFEEFPQSLGYSFNQINNDPELIERFILQLQSSIHEINGAYESLISRIEKFIVDKISGQKIEFPEYKNILITRYSSIPKHKLLTKHKVFIQRIKSPLDDRNTWINSLAYALIDKSLETINDDEENVFYDEFVKITHELDNLIEISDSQLDNEIEEVYKIEITSLLKGLEKKLIRLPKNKLNDIENIKATISELIKNNDSNINLAVLAKLLQDQLNDNE